MRFKTPPGPLIGLAFAAALCALVERVAAQEYCVACTEPPAVYRCVIDGARAGGSQSLQMLCITAMAKEGQHTTCGVKGGTVFDCSGPVKRVPWAAYNAAPQEPGSQSKAAASPPKNPSQPPQTVEEMAKEANQKTVEQIKKTNDAIKQQTQSLGEKVGDATKKTWRCISSLFTRCLE